LRWLWPAVWEARFGRPSLTSLYQSAMEAIYKVHPSAIFVLEVRSHEDGCQPSLAD